MVAVWDELLETNPPKDLLFFGWRNAAKAPAAREAGYAAVSCPQEHAYFDWAESDRPDEPVAIRGFLPLEKAYAFTTEVIVDNALGRDFEEGLSAFTQKRRPVWPEGKGG